MPIGLIKNWLKSDELFMNNYKKFLENEMKKMEGVTKMLNDIDSTLKHLRRCDEG